MKLLKFLFFLGVTAAILYLIIRKIDYFSLRDAFLNIKSNYLALGFAVILLTPVFSAKRWQAMLGTMNYPLGFRDSFKIIMAAFPVSSITPAKAGDLIRAHYLKDKIPAVQVVGGVATERLTDIFVLALYSFTGAVLLKNWLIMGISFTIIFLIPIFFFVINKIKFSSGVWRQRIDNFLLVSKIFIRKPSKFLPILSYSLILWLLPILEVKILFLALGVNVPLIFVAAAFPLAIFIGLLPITIAGMGTRDSAVIYFFSAWAASSVSLGVGILYSLLAYWFLAILGLPFMKKML